MIDRIRRDSTRQPSPQPPPQAVNLTVNVQIPEAITEVLKMMLLRATVPAGESHVETSVTGTAPQPSLFPEFAPHCPRQQAEPRSPEPPVNGEPAAPAVPPPGCESFLNLYRTLCKSARSKKAGKQTIIDHEGSFRQFDAWFRESRYYRSPTPIVSAFEQSELLEEFVTARLAAGNSVVTVGRRLTHLMMLANAAHKARLIAHVAVSKLSKTQLQRLADSGSSGQATPAVRKIPTREECDQLATRVGAMTYPYGDASPYFWRGLVRYHATFGPRTRDLVSVSAAKSGLKKSDVIWDTLCPLDDVNAALGRELHSPHGWLWYVIGKDHLSDCRRVLFPMPEWCRSWLRFFCERSDDPERVFPSAQPGSASLSSKSFGAAWRRLVKHADVDSRIRLSEGSGRAIALRKYAANWWMIQTLQRKGDAALADKMSDYVLHHSTVTVSQKHYLSVQAAVLPTMLELLPSFPVPAGDAPPVSLLGE